MALVIKTTGIEDYLDAGTANIKCLVMGHPGAGKTRSAGFWPKPILADCEKGRMSVADLGIPYAEITSSADMDALLKMLQLECNKPVDQRQYQTLVIDTVDSYQRLLIDERLTEQKKESLSGWQDWGWLDGKMMQFVAKLHQLQMNIVVNNHIKDSQVTVAGGEADTDEEAAKITVSKPRLKGDYKDQIAAEFDLVGRMGTYWEAVEGERVLLRGIQWWPDPNNPLLKDRSGQLPRWTPVTFTNEDHANLFTALTSHLDSLQGSTELMSLETNPAVTAEPVAPQGGGPVEAPMVPPTSTKKAEPKEALQAEVVDAPAPSGPVATAPPPAAAVAPPTQVATDVGVQGVPASSGTPSTQPESAGADAAPEGTGQDVPQTVAEVPAVASATPDEAVATVQQTLGGQVISDGPSSEVATTDAAAPVVDGQVSQEVVDGVICGTGTEGLGSDETPVPGCGKAIELDGPNAEPNPMLVEIAQLKTRTNLCNACFTAHRAASN